MTDYKTIESIILKNKTDILKGIKRSPSSKINDIWVNDKNILIRLTDGNNAVFSIDYITKKYCATSYFKSVKEIFHDLVNTKEFSDNICEILQSPDKKFKQYVINKYRLFDLNSTIAKTTENYTIDGCYNEILSLINQAYKCQYK